MKVIQEKILDQLVDEAKTSPRLRKNLNLHTELNEPIQRMCNAFEPDTYVRPHRHPQAGVWELFVVLTGEADVVLFDQDGMVTQRVSLSAGGPNYVVEIPPQTWHTVVSQQTGTVLFEVKQGPYQPLTEQDFASWAPAENNARAAELLAWLRHCSVGQQAPALT